MRAILIILVLLASCATIHEYELTSTKDPTRVIIMETDLHLGIGDTVYVDSTGILVKKEN